jgi:hypothetical protein
MISELYPNVLMLKAKKHLLVHKLQFNKKKGIGSLFKDTIRTLINSNERIGKNAEAMFEAYPEQINAATGTLLLLLDFLFTSNLK